MTSCFKVNQFKIVIKNNEYKICIVELTFKINNYYKNNINL